MIRRDRIDDVGLLGPPFADVFLTTGDGGIGNTGGSSDDGTVGKTVDADSSGIGRTGDTNGDWIPRSGESLTT